MSPTLRPFRWALPGVAAAVVVAAAAAAGAAAPAAAGARTFSAAVLRRAHAVRIEAPRPAPAPCPVEPPIDVGEVELPGALELARRIREDPASLGSASIGSPARGRLWGGVELLPGDGITRGGSHPWGTASVIRSIERAVRQVRACHPGAPDLFVGDISRKEGGWLKPHKSHQAGLDADVGYYYVSGPAWFETATESNLDKRRTWALVRAFLDGGNVESIYMDRFVQRMLRKYAEEAGEDAARLDKLFESPPKWTHEATIHHASGHGGHFHVRFRDAAAVALGTRLAYMLGGKAPAGKPVPRRK